MAVIQYAGCQSRKINIEQSSRQGCRLSPLLFTVIIEMLNLAVKQCSGMQGIFIGQVKHKITLYADDIVFFLQQPFVDSLKALLQVIQLFTLDSGYKINQQKSALMDLGVCRDEKMCISQLFSAKWKHQDLHYVVIKISDTMTSDLLTRK